jgi:hypothetical protein
VAKYFCGSIRVYNNKWPINRLNLAKAIYSIFICPSLKSDGNNSVYSLPLALANG